MGCNRNSLRRLWLALLVTLMGASLVAAIPFTDTFTRADGALGANWTAQGDAFNPGGTLSIASNAVRATAGSSFPCAMASTAGAGTFTANQTATITLGVFDAADAVGVILRSSGNWQTTTFTAYYLSMDNGGGIDAIVNNTGITILTGLGTTWTAGDTARLDVEGTTLRVYKNNVQIGSATNTAIATGQPGICLFDSEVPASGDTTVETFAADNIGGVAPLTRALLLLGVGHP